jgi:choline-phosphate cytidylyltransferase
MDRPQTRQSRKLSLRNRPIKILLPGHFSFIHAGHRSIISEVKSSFKNVVLIVAIIEDETIPSILTSQEKLSTMKSFPEVDQVLLIPTPPSEKDLQDWKIDLLASGNPSKYKEIGQVLRIEKKHKFSTSLIIAKIIRNSEDHLSRLLNQGYHRSSLNISRLSEISIKARVKLSSIKKSLTRKSSSPEYISRYLEQCKKVFQLPSSFWSPSRVLTLRTWLEQGSSASKCIQKLFSDIWESA